VGVKVEGETAAEVQQWFEASANSGSLVDYLKTFDVTTALMQTKRSLTRIASEFVADLVDDGVIYGEVRWAPEQHQLGGLTLDEAVDAVQDGLELGMHEAEKRGRFVRTGQLITAMRQSDRSLEIAELAVRHREAGVVGFDIAGPELGFPPSNHQLAFDYLASELMPVTVHAGEAAGVDSIRDALVSGRALRIGHGVRLLEDLLHSREDGDTDFVELGPVARWIYDRGIGLEICPTSNLQTGALNFLLGDDDDGEDDTRFSFADHPFTILMDLGFKVTISPDNRLLGGTSVSRELELAVKHLDLDLDDLLTLQLNAASVAFQDREQREELMDVIEQGFSRAGNDRSR
jgi:adenosine deaminase